MSELVSSYHSGNSHEFNRLSDQIGTNIQKFSQNVTSMRKMVAQLGVSSNSEELRAQVNNVQHYTNQLARDTSGLFKKMHNLPPPDNPSEERQRKLQKDRLFNEFGNVLNTFQKTQKESAQKEKESLQKARASSHQSLGPMGGDGRQQQLIQLESPVQNQMVLLEDDVDLDMLREREQQMHQLENDIVNVNEIFRDLAHMVHEQGEVIDSIEANIESTHIHVSDGAEQLSKARDYQSSVRKKKLCIFIILIIIVAVIIGVIVYYAQK